MKKRLKMLVRYLVRLLNRLTMAVYGILIFFILTRVKLCLQTSSGMV
ncbi:hypothetical protein [Peptostreptococcus faecalis]|nr:hypothetical protein [Peptostreptococcus faecalis]